MSGRPVVIGRPATRQVAFVGPYGVGKTTAVRALSSLPVASAEAKTSHGKHHRETGRHHQDDKDTTTVGIDYGQWKGPEGTIALYGTPGQSRFQASRDQAVATATGIVLWLFGHQPDALEEAEAWLTDLGARRLAPRLVVAVTRTEADGAIPLAGYRTLLDRYDPSIPLTTADPRDAGDVERVVRAALERAASDSTTSGSAASDATGSGS